MYSLFATYSIENIMNGYFTFSIFLCYFALFIRSAGKRPAGRIKGQNKILNTTCTDKENIYLSVSASFILNSSWRHSLSEVLSSRLHLLTQDTLEQET